MPSTAWYYPCPGTANAEDAIDRLDEMLKVSGGTGAIARKDQLSHQFLTEEIKQQETNATVFPCIFLGVAAFLLNVVATRLMGPQREQIAALKAFGYSDLAVGLHYAKLVLLIETPGVAGGIGLGILLGKGMSNIYREFYSLPYMIYVLRPGVIAAAALISIGVARGDLACGAHRRPPATGAGHAARAPARLSCHHRGAPWPAALVLPADPDGAAPHRAPAPQVSTDHPGHRHGLWHHDDRWVPEARHRRQHGGRAVAGSASAGTSPPPTEPTLARSLYSLRSLQGVEHAEGFRSVPVRLRFGHRSYRTTLEGIEPAGTLLRLLDTDLAGN